MKAIFNQLKKEANALISAIGLKSGPKKVIGLDIGHKTFRAIRSDESLRQSDTKNILIKDIACLKDLNKDFQVQTDEKIAVNFHGDMVAIRRTSIPIMPKQEIGEALRWQLKDNIQFDIDNASLRFDIIGEKEDQSGVKKMDVIAIVYQEQDVVKKIEELRGFGLNIQAVFPSEFALATYASYAHIISGQDKVAIVDIGSVRTNIAIIENTKVCFSRDINIGGDDITEAMTCALLSDKGRIEFSMEEAEKIKREQGIPNDIKILSLMRPVIEKLSGQIKKSLEYCEQVFQCPTIDKIILAGNGAQLKGLREFITKETGLEVLNILEETACAIGLSFTPDSCLNMLPERFAVEKKALLKKISLRMVFIIMVLLFFISYGFLSFGAVRLKREIGILKAHWQNVKGIKPIKERVIELTQTIAIIQDGSVDSGNIEKELSHLIPDYCLLDKLFIGKDEPHIRISGVISEGSRLTEFMDALEKSMLFENVKLKFSRKLESYSKDALEFELLFNVTR